MPKARVASGLAFAALLAAPAEAHGALGGMGPFWSGALHLAVSPLSVASLLGTAAALGGTDVRDAGRAALAGSALGACAALAYQVPGGLAAPAAAVLGGIAVLALRPQGRFALCVGSLGGIATAIAGRPDTIEWPVGPGAALFIFLGLSLATAAFHELDARFPLVRRVAGAWVAAIGLLLGALALRT